MRVARLGWHNIRLRHTMASPVTRIVTYNVLSPTLCSPDWFPECKPAACKAENRLGKVLTQLEPYVKEDSIICLQEVGVDWFGAFHTFFDQFNYTLILYNYKTTMGVGLAYPKSKFVAQSVQNCRVGEFIRPREPDETEIEAVQKALQEVKRGKREIKAAQLAMQAQEEERAKDAFGLNSWSLSKSFIHATWIDHCKPSMQHGTDTMSFLCP
eukprot:TRINITY_DN9122_c0_g1_i3.p1 TRINITY_DN9122_c0_g1~~TRINITY_DN9122_c0_g1_i3.p1  ORF type:complete len:212 (+),score=24.32 TRINITY_DN9122_c0_g1_i3:155-790(+)